MTDVRGFHDIRSSSGLARPAAKPVEDFMAEMEGIQASVCATRNRVWERVADGTLSLPYLRRFCCEYYFLGVWYTSEFGSLVANAPDADALGMEASEHFAHWVQNLADETGFAGDRNHVDMKVEWARMLDLSDADLAGYSPLPETLGMVLASLYYMRRSYEEGLAAFGWAGERFAATTGYAELMYEGMKEHYGLACRTSRSTPTPRLTTATPPTTCCARWRSPPSSSTASAPPSPRSSPCATPGPSPSTAGWKNPAPSGRSVAWPPAGSCCA